MSYRLVLDANADEIARVIVDDVTGMTSYEWYSLDSAIGHEMLLELARKEMSPSSD